MRTAGAVLWLTTLGLVSPAHADTNRRPVLVVLDLVAEQGVSSGTVRLLNELLLTEFNRTGKYEVLGGSDVVTMINTAAERQKLGCTDTACLTELGGALGADLLAAATIGRVGDYFLLNVKILDVHDSRVLARWTTQIEGIENKLMNAVHDTVAAVTRTGKLQAASSPPPAATPSPAVAEAPPPAGVEAHVQPAPTSSASRLKWIAAGAAAVTGAGGAILGLLAARDAGAARREFAGTPAWQAKKDAVKTKAAGADVLYAFAALTAVTSIVLFATDSPPTTVTTAAAPVAGGASLILIATWF
ncbi:MAG: hypothetical protein HY903_01330 [Deltaproteobacteria bacterium]|nr:hypothetical protein [Deltaproteobacteria bacterium]